MSFPGSEWSGRLVVRLLPQNVSGDYEAAKLANPRRVQGYPSLVDTPHTPLVRFDPTWIDTWRLSECACVSLDMNATDGSSNVIAIHMNRSPSEAVDTSLQRLWLSLRKKLARRLKGGNLCPDVKYSFRRSDGTVFDCSTESHFEVWTRAFTNDVHVQMSLDDVQIHLKVECCPPTLVTVKSYEAFGAHIFVGIPLVVTVELIFASHVVVDWYVDGQRVKRDSRSYEPSAEDIGKCVMILVTPTRPDCATCPEAYQFKHVVRDRPDNAILGLRHDFCAVRENDDKLRVLSYNVLADLNAFSAKDGISFYPYCDAKFIRKERRLPLILFEILQYQADIICLQEVDHGVFYGLLMPALEYHGYEGYFTSKLGTQEGGAMFWSLDVFEPLLDSDRKSHVIRDLFVKDHYLGDWSSMPEVFWLLDCHSGLNEMLRERLGHVLQTAILTRRDDQRKVVVGNTHLYFHPMASHVRLLQLYACLHQVQVERHGHFPVVFCGDLNSSPTSGAVKLLFDRIVSPSSGRTDQGTTWKHLHTFSWAREYKDPPDPNHSLEIPIIRLPDSFPILCSGYNEMPKYTHYTHNFAATLDYIFVSQDVLKPVTWATMPTEEVLTQHVAMPSEVLPSDHVCLVCDLEWS
jgi:mRNA deadenylase 3'-5' endonuclease subunit Ccr4